MKTFVIDYPATYSDEDVERVFQEFRTEHPDITDQWFTCDTPHRVGEFDIRSLQKAVFEFLKSRYEWTDSTALASFWMEMRGIVYNENANGRT